MIVADANEPEDYRKMADRVDSLPIDYIIDGERRRYAIERKTVMDLLSSVRDGRLWDQLESLVLLKQDGYIPIVVIEGLVYSYLKSGKMTLAQWLGIQSGIASFSVATIMVSGKKQLKFLLDMLSKKAGQKREYVRPTIRKSKKRSIRDERVDMLSAVSGIGIKTAEVLIDAFQSPYGVCLNAEKLDVLIGSKAVHLKEVLGVPRSDVSDSKRDDDLSSSSSV